MGASHGARHDSAGSGDRPPTLIARLDQMSRPGALFLVAALIVSALSTISAIRDPDFWWHLRAGQLIIDRHGLLGTDPFTYTAEAHHWTMHEWLSEVVIAALHAAGGLALIVVVLCGITWAGLLCIHARARLRSPGVGPLAGGILLASVAGYPIWGPRAQMITFALSCVTLLAAERQLTRGGRAIWWLVPVFTVWSNLHSGFVIGLAFLGLMAGAELVATWWRRPGAAPADRVRRLLLVTGACALASMVNLNGPGILLYPFGTQGSAEQQAVIQEWHSPDFHQWEALGFEVMVMSLGAMIALNRRLALRDVALVLATTALAFQSVRHIALFVAAATPVWVEQASMLMHRLQGRRAGRPLPPLGIRVAALGLVTITVGGTAGARLATAVAVREGSPFYATDFPVCAATWLESSAVPLRIFNQYGAGGYLAYRLSHRGDRVFIFGDAALMGDELLRRYADVETVTPRWESVIRDTGTDVVLFDRGTPLATVMEASHDWMRVYRDRRDEAFVARDRASQLRLPPVPAGAAAEACGATGANG